MLGLALSAEDNAALIAFLKSLRPGGVAMTRVVCVWLGKKRA
jgi:hypothetical protein